jgi:CheY-like chemotaxis protein
MAEILVIDDMAGVRRAVESMLSSAGHKVTTASNGVEGLEHLKQRRFDLVVCDILMPQVDGTEVVFQLHAMPNRPPLLAISGGGAGVSAGDALKMARIKADAFLEKPFDKERFMSTIGALLPKRA